MNYKNNFLAKKTLWFQLIGIFIILAIVMSIIMMSAIFLIYQNRIYGEYADKGRIISHFVSSQLDSEMMDYYLSRLTKDEKYEEILDFIREVQTEFEVKYIYIVKPTAEGELYVFDSDKDLPVNLGEVEPWSDAQKSLVDNMLRGEKLGPLVLVDRWGWHFTNYAPVYRPDGSVSVYVGVDISMEEITRERRLAITMLGSIILFLLCVLSALYLLMVRKTVITPLENIVKKVSEYRNKFSILNQPSSEKQKELSSLRSGNEITILAYVITEMMSHIDHEVEVVKKAKDAERISNMSRAMLLSFMNQTLEEPLKDIIYISEQAINSKIYVSAYEEIALNSEYLLVVLSTINELLEYPSDQTTNLNRYVTFDDTLVSVFANALCDVKHITWETDFSTVSKLQLIGDKLRLKQVLAILLMEAIRRTDVNGYVRITATLVSETESDVSIWFDLFNNGVGLSDEDVNMLTDIDVFNESLQSNESFAMLYIAQKIAHSMGGNIRAINHANKGFSLYFSLKFLKL